MPEKFSFATLIEGPSTLTQRLSFLDQAPRIFARWLQRHRDVMRLNIRSGHSESWQWPVADRAVRGHLSEDEFLFVYFDSEAHPSQSVVSMFEQDAKSEFTVTLPNMDIAGEPAEIERCLISLARWANSTNQEFLAVAGGEVGIEEEWRSVDSGVRAAALPNSLATWICCPREAISGDLPNFEIAVEDGTAVVLRRQP